MSTASVSGRLRAERLAAKPAEYWMPEAVKARKAAAKKRRQEYLEHCRRIDVLIRGEKQGEPEADQPAMRECPACGHENAPIGALGRVLHFNCRACGSWYTTTGPEHRS